MPFIVTGPDLDRAVAELSDARKLVAAAIIRYSDADPEAEPSLCESLEGSPLATVGYRTVYARQVSWADVAAGAHLPRPSEAAAARFPNVLIDAYNRVADSKGFSWPS